MEKLTTNTLKTNITVSNSWDYPSVKCGSPRSATCGTDLEVQI
jgi:hypothetical protein